MINFYDVIAASEGIAVADEFATLWGRKISGGYVISTYTGTLPATLQTVAGFLVGYEIWGNTGGVGNEAIVASLPEPLCGIDTYSDSLDLSTGTLTRRIKKLVLTGEENVTESDTNYKLSSVAPQLPISRTALICTRFTAATGTINVGTCRFGGSLSSPNTTIIVNYDNGVGGANAFKQYLAQQYANGTPVTVWYVLAEPEISTIPVPSGLTGTIEGYLIQDGTPTPEAPIYPTANGVKQSDGTYSIVYGYKLPITSNDTTTDIYIGDTQLAKDEYVDSETGKIYKWADITGLSEPLCGIGEYTDSLDLSTGGLMRRIKKLVLTGSEDWTSFEQSGTTLYRCANSLAGKLAESPVDTMICNCLQAVSSRGGCASTSNSISVYNVQSDSRPVVNVNPMTLSEWTTFIQQQYAAGTPVTIWYVLAEPEISTIPVPSGLTGTIEGYLIQDGTPTPESPIYPTANGAKQADGTYSIESAYITPTDPPVPLPLIPTAAGETTISYGGAGVQPEKVELKYRR